MSEDPPPSDLCVHRVPVLNLGLAAVPEGRTLSVKESPPPPWLRYRCAHADRRLVAASRLSPHSVLATPDAAGQPRAAAPATHPAGRPMLRCASSPSAPSTNTIRGVLDPRRSHPWHGRRHDLLKTVVRTGSDGGMHLYLNAFKNHLGGDAAARRRLVARDGCEVVRARSHLRTRSWHDGADKRDLPPPYEAAPKRRRRDRLSRARPAPSPRGRHPARCPCGTTSCRRSGAQPLRGSFT